jgi:hypothetical protein
MACYLLNHRHKPDECGVVFASLQAGTHLGVPKPPFTP